LKYRRFASQRSMLVISHQSVARNRKNSLGHVVRTKRALMPTWRARLRRRASFPPSGQNINYWKEEPWSCIAGGLSPARFCCSAIAHREPKRCSLWSMGAVPMARNGREVGRRTWRHVTAISICQECYGWAAVLLHTRHRSIFFMSSKKPTRRAALTALVAMPLRFAGECLRQAKGSINIARTIFIGRPPLPKVRWFAPICHLRVSQIRL
jgi:hypothetical protein